MNAGTLISMDEYLETSYSPDCEYIDGVLVERHVGEKPHSKVQRRITVSLTVRYTNFHVWPEQRVRTVPGMRSRVPDVCVTLEEPPTDVFETPPFICIEILSKRDEMTNVLEKLVEYEAFGVPHIWLIDPRRMKAYTFSEGRLEEVRADAFTTSQPEIRLPLEEIFRGL
jgi:Uma2 family endonuclease